MCVIPAIFAHGAGRRGRCAATSHARPAATCLGVPTALMLLPMAGMQAAVLLSALLAAALASRNDPGAPARAHQAQRTINAKYSRNIHSLFTRNSAVTHVYREHSLSHPFSLEGGRIANWDYYGSTGAACAPRAPTHATQ